MPNWVENTLTISGTTEDVKKFVEENKNEEGEFSFEASLPMPEDYFTGDLGAAEKAKYGDKTWFRWNVSNWGTKWDACDAEDWGFDTEEGDEEGSATIYFLTAWGAPKEYIENVSRIYPNIEFYLQYVEHGMQFCGIAEANNGDFSDNELDYGIEYPQSCDECGEDDCLEQECLED